jgi:hypothetical protein
MPPLNQTKKQEKAENRTFSTSDYSLPKVARISQFPETKLHT